MLLIQFVFTPGIALAQTRTITGRVSEAGSGIAIPSVQIAVKGTVLGTLSRDDGSFTVAAPERDLTLSLRRIGYPRTEFAVAATQSMVQIELRKDVLKLDEVVVTGQSTGISRRNLPTSIATVNAEELTQVPAASIEHALQGKVAGAQIQSNTGAPGGGNRIRLRGITSLVSAAQPLYVVDGVIASDVAIAPGTNRITRAAGATAIAVSAQENPVNRIADLNPEDIENIEVLKGAAASAIYGSKASSGVILITTKKGRVGAPKFTLRQGLGTSELSYKENSRQFRTVEDALAAFGPADSVRKYYDPAKQLDYEEIAFGNQPLNHETALTVSGGTQDTRYFISGLIKHDGGIVENTYADKKSMRLNLDQNLGARLRASLNTEFLRTESDRGLFGNDNAGNSIYYTVTKIPSFLDLRRSSDGSFPVNPFYSSNPLQTIALLKNEETVFRTIMSGRLTLDAFTSRQHAVQLIAAGGVDFFNQKNTVFSPPQLQFEKDDGFLGTHALSIGQSIQTNVNLNGVHVWTPRRGAFSATTSLGTQYETRDLDIARDVSENLLSGQPNLRDGTRRDLDQQKEKAVDFGLFAQEEVLLSERLLLTAGVRADRSSNNGDPGKFYFYPKASGSFRIPAIWPGRIDEFKLRVAYGESGNQPIFGQKFTTLNTPNIDGIGGFTIGGTSSAKDLRPERQREIEGGFDAALFNNRGTAEFTVFEKRISDLLLDRTLPPSVGYATERFNGGVMRVRGLETVLGLYPIQTADFGWGARINFAMNRSKILELPVPAFFFSTPQVGAVKIEQGKSATQLFGNDTVSRAGFCPDGTVCPNARVGQVIATYMGDGNPDYTLGVSNDFRYKRLNLYVLLDRQQGGMLAAGTWRHYDLGQNSRDYDALTASGERLGAQRVRVYRNVTRIYYQDATYTKLRELTLGFEIPERWTDRVWGRANNVRLNLSGRNLYWWTDFRGGDPDFANFGGGNDNLQRNRELAAFPASRSYWFSLTVGF